MPSLWTPLGSTKSPTAPLTSVNGCASYQFVYGETTRYAHRTRIVQVASASGPISASDTIRGLTPNAKYHFTVFAYSARGKTVGPDLTVTTKLASAVRIAPGPAYLDRPFVAGIRLSCPHGGGGCAGAVKIFSAHRLIGRHRFFLRRGRTAVILVGLDRLGRALFRARPALRVEVRMHGSMGGERKPGDSRLSRATPGASRLPDHPLGAASVAQSGVA